MLFARDIRGMAEGETITATEKDPANCWRRLQLRLFRDGQERALLHRLRVTFRGPDVECNEMNATEHTLTSWDGSQLFYRAWIPNPLPKKALLLFHRGHEHSGRWQE